METCNEEPHQATLFNGIMKAEGSIRRNKKNVKSEEIIEKMLRRLGLSKNEAKIFLYLTLSKERKASEIAKELNLHRTDTYRTLQDLEKKGLVSSVFEKPLKFIATSFDQAVGKLIEAKKLRIQRLEREKKALIDLWLSLPKPEIEEQRKEVFQMLEGEEQIDLKATEIIQKAKKEVAIFISEEDWQRFYNSKFMETLERNSNKICSIKLLTNNSAKSHFFVEKTSLLNKRFLSTENNAIPTFVLMDKEQLILMIRKASEKTIKRTSRPKIAALWTNYEAMTKALGALFTELWTRKATR
jgi:sugar-specific transcriptional regulator TrmB